METTLVETFAWFKLSWAGHVSKKDDIRLTGILGSETEVQRSKEKSTTKLLK